jgi:hypothetical protein
VSEVCDALVEKLKDYVQGRQILLFVAYERSLKLDLIRPFIKMLWVLWVPYYQNVQETAQN